MVRVIFTLCGSATFVLTIKLFKNKIQPATSAPKLLQYEIRFGAAMRHLASHFGYVHKL